MTVCKVYGIAGFEMTEEKDMAKVTFDYSKASKFISDDEVVAMKKIADRDSYGKCVSHQRRND